jgi:putative hydrolase of the HAD superfamily
MAAFQGILFDFYNTLGTRRDPDECVEATALIEFGFAVDVAAVRHAVGSVNNRMNGAEPIDHSAHSLSRAAYIEYQRGNHAGWLREMGVDPYHPGLFERLADLWDDPSRIHLFDDTLPVLTSLRAAGFRLGLVSNWSWDLHAVLESTGLAPLLDCVVISARAGYRKPHPAIYEKGLGAIALPAHAVLFVGDHPHADIEGPLGAGMTPVHIDRFGESPVIPGVTRITSLYELVGILTG